MNGDSSALPPGYSETPPAGTPLPPGYSETPPPAGPQGRGYERGGEAFLSTIRGHLQQLADVTHDLLTATRTGDWDAIQKKYPPTEASPTAGGLWQTIKGGYSSVNPIEVKRTPAGDVDVPATIGATLGNTALIAGPLHEIFRGGEPPPAAAPPAAQAAAAAEAEAGPKLTLAQRHPELTTKLARAGGAGVGGTLGGAVAGPPGATAGGYIGSEIAGQWAKKYTQVPEAPPAPPSPPPITGATPGDWLAKQYGYANEADAVAKAGQATWDQVKAMGPKGVQQGRVPGQPRAPRQPPPVREPPPEEPSSTAPAQPSPTPTKPAPSGVELGLAKQAAPPLPRDVNDALDDNALLQRFRQDIEHEASGVEVEKNRGTYMAQLPSGGATKGMETTAASAAIKGQEAPAWTQLSNWKDVDPMTGDIGRDTKQVLLGDYSPNNAASDGSKNIYVTQEQYEAAKKRWHQKTGEE